MKTARLALILCIIVSSLLVSAQSEDIYTFDSGVSFSIPAGAQLDDIVPPSLYFGDEMVVEMVEPGFIGVTAEATIGVPLEDVLVYLLGLVGHPDPANPANTFTETLADGREVLGEVFVNGDELVQTVVVVRFSDDSVGALNIRSVSPLGAAEQQMLRTLSVSFDVPGDAAPTPVAPVKATPAPVATLVPAPTNAPEAAALPQSHTYESGVSFGYPADYDITSVDDPPVSIGIADVIFITMVDPNIVGMPAGETMDSIIDFAVRNLPLDPATFEPFDVGGREAAYGFAPSDPYIQSMVLVRFADGTVGIMDIVTNEPLDGDLLDEVRAIAASFDSASETFSGVTREQFDQSRALFDEGMDFYDVDDYESALPLLEQAVELDPSFTLGIYWRGATQQHLGNLEAAAADYELALANEPDQRQILTDLAEVYGLLDEMDLALAAINAYLDDPGEDGAEPGTEVIAEMYERVAAGEYDADFYYSRASFLRELGLYEDALRDALTALTNEPMEPILYALHGAILIDMDRDQDAVTTLTKGLTIEPTAILFLNRGFAYQGLVLSEFSAMIDAAHDFQCVLLLADDTVSEGQIADAERALVRMIISSDEYEEYTDPAQCAA